MSGIAVLFCGPRKKGLNGFILRDRGSTRLCAKGEKTLSTMIPISIRKTFMPDLSDERRTEKMGAKKTLRVVTVIEKLTYIKLLTHRPNSLSTTTRKGPQLQQSEDMLILFATKYKTYCERYENTSNRSKVFILVVVSGLKDMVHCIYVPCKLG